MTGLRQGSGLAGRQEAPSAGKPIDPPLPLPRLPLSEIGRPAEPTWGDRGVAALLFGAVLLVLVATSPTVGVARDEATYAHAAETYRRYLETTKDNPAKRRDPQVISRFYRENAEHPPGTKHLYGLSWAKLRKGPVTEPGIKQSKARLASGEPPLDGSLALLDDLTALRLPAMVAAALLVAFIYLFGTLAFGRLAGLLAALGYACLPRVYYHSHLAGLDAPITAALFVTVYFYYRGLWSWRFSIAAGLCYALALLAKFNAFFLPLVLVVHYAWASRRDFRHPLLGAVALLSLLPLAFLSLAALVSRGGRASGPWILTAALCLAGLFVLRRGSLARPLRAAALMAPAVFFSMLILGGALFYLQWPWLWDDTLQRFGGYLRYHLEHTFYNTEFMGKNYNLPPFPVSYPFLLSALTMPLVFLAGSLGGLALALRQPIAAIWPWLTSPQVSFKRWLGKSGQVPHSQPSEASDGPHRSWGRPLRGQDRAPAFLISVNALFWLGLIAAPSTPIFGGTRLWMPSWPFLALLGGWAAQWLWLRAAGNAVSMAEPSRRALAPAMAAALVLAMTAPGALQILHAGDVGPSWFSPQAGGPAGAADQGHKRQYWGYSTRRALPTLNGLLEDPARPGAARSQRPGPATHRPSMSVYFHDTNHFSRDLYVRIGLLSPRITYAGDGLPGIRRSEAALFLYEKHQVMWEHRIWQEYGTVRPDYVLTLDGVPLLTLYLRRGRHAPRPPFFEDPPGF
ncbi:MAG: glycosyltransferase family 39 protein [Polyangia bacterium]|jgi:hypothetical protein|nr:glycosyltransferase family 39 protein [Polyangia bacterium]